MTEPRDVPATPEPALSAAPSDPADAANVPADPALPLTPLGAERLAVPEATPLSDPADASLLALIDHLSSLLDRTDLTELEIQAGETALVLRKPSAIAPVAAAAPPVGVYSDRAAYRPRATGTHTKD